MIKDHELGCGFDTPRADFLDAPLPAKAPHRALPATCDGAGDRRAGRHGKRVQFRGRSRGSRPR
jgi:hypothetical protein